MNGGVVTSKKTTKKAAMILDPTDQDEFTGAMGITREKAKCLLLPSQI